MKALPNCPAWPEIMTRETALLYLGNKTAILDELIRRGWVWPFSQGHKRVTYRKSVIDSAIALAEEAELFLECSEAEKSTSAA